MRVYKNLKLEILTLILVQPFLINSQNWLPMDNGFNCTFWGSVHNIAVAEDNDLLLLGGVLPENAYCEEIRSCVYWNENHWQGLGQSFNVNFLPVEYFQNQIYSASNFGDSHFAKWDGMNWDTIPNGPSSFGINEIIIHDYKLYAGGSFTSCGNIPSSLIFSYDGIEIEPLVNQFSNTSQSCKAMEFYHDTLFVGGIIRDYDREIFAFASVYDFDIHRAGQMLSANSGVQAMGVFDDKLWLGGGFDSNDLGLDYWSHLAYYDGERIYPSEIQPNGSVKAMKVYDDALYFAGEFNEINGKECHNVARIKNGACECLNYDTIYHPNGYPLTFQPYVIRDIEIWHDTLYLGGHFSHIGESYNLNSIAKLNRSLSDVEEIKLSDSFDLFPNPASQQITLSTNSFFNTDAYLELYNSVGQRVQNNIWRKYELEHIINIEQLSPGIYFLSINTESGITTKRFIIE